MNPVHEKSSEKKIQLLTRTILSIFRLNSALLNGGNQLLREQEVDSTDWQVLGAIALTELPMTAPAIADEMGMTRQGAQKRLNKLKAGDYVFHVPNPRHDRSPIWRLTDKGKALFQRIMELYEMWMKRLLDEFPIVLDDLNAISGLLDKMEHTLANLDIKKDVLQLSE
ncbi:MAG: MarR family winged helix-turn-helix transcriptional regulator [Pseudomonadota bacterium]